MPKVSKNALEHSIKEKILGSFYWVIAHLMREKEVSDVFNDLLTRTERVMIAKRVVALFLLSKDLKIREISNLLKMSTATVAKLQEKLDMKSTGIQSILTYLEKKEKLDAFLKMLGAVAKNAAKFIPPQKHDMRRRWELLH